MESSATQTPISEVTQRKLRLLVTIASYGVKNLAFLNRIIRQYQSMTMDVDVVVLSDGPKDLDGSAKLIVGLPAKNPWSLPFAHKAILAENLDRYDLFAYSEDDMEVTEENIHAFLRATPELEDDEIAGFLRFEIDDSGVRSFPEIHGTYHWKPESVKRRGPYTVAEFSNEHAAFYILTQTQLRRAIASGGFLRSPYASRYDMACTAATDPYTSCGFRKVICISALHEFTIHHLPNRYAGKIGLGNNSFKEQIQTLLDIRSGDHSGTSLCHMESRILHGRWSKSYYEQPGQELLRSIPSEAKTILSIGCGSGATEMELMKRGAKVTALPLDSVIGAAASRLGIEVVYGNLEEGFRKLGTRKFQCLLISNMLHLLADPLRLIDESARRVDTGGNLLIAGVNFDYLPILLRRLLQQGDYKQLGSFSESGINVLNTRAIIQQIERHGLQLVALQRIHDPRPGQKSRVLRCLDRWTAAKWIIHAQKGTAETSGNPS